MTGAAAQRSYCLRDAAQVWFVLTLAAGFAGWVLGSSPPAMLDPAAVPARYAAALALAATPAALLTAAAVRLGRLALLARAAYGAGCVYLGVLKAAGFGLAPWLALGLVPAAALAVRTPPQLTPLFVLAPLSWSLAALYFALSAERWLAGIVSFAAMAGTLLR